jgi:hypothetical protein
LVTVKITGVPVATQVRFTAVDGTRDDTAVQPVLIA